MSFTWRHPLRTDPPLRIALAIGTLDVGGAEMQVVGTARALHEMGHDVEVLVLSSATGPLASVLADIGIPIRSLGYNGLRRRNKSNIWARTLGVARLVAFPIYLRHRRFDVLHAYLFEGYAVFMPLAWLAGVKVRVAGRRGLHESLRPIPFLLSLTRLSTRFATAVVANSEAVADDARSKEHVPLDKLYVIPNGVDLPDHLADPSIDPAKGLIIASLIHYKGHLDLVAALASLARPPMVRCIGEGPMRGQLETAISSTGLQSTMLLEGERFSARLAYADVQFAVLCSHAEGMPNAVLEAMAAGLPVVVTDVGGCRELVEDGVTGYVVPPHAPHRLAAAIASLAADGTFRVRAGRTARSRAQAYSWEACAQAHLSLYRGLSRASSDAP